MKQDQEEIEVLNPKEVDLELDDFINKLLEANVDKINSITKWIDISQLLGVISIFAFLILLAVRVNVQFTFSWFYISIPLFITLISYTVLLHMYLRLKDIMDEAERKPDEENTTQFGTFISYFCLHIVSVDFLVYLICLCLKMDNLITSSWNTVTITVYINLAVFFLYSIFIFPAFIQNKLYIEILLIVSYLFNSFAFVLLIKLKLDGIYVNGFVDVFIPVYFAVGLHFLFSILNIFIHKAEYYARVSLSVFLGVCLIVAGLIAVKADGRLANMPNYIPVLVFMCGCVVMFVEKMYYFFKPQEENETEKE